jgi:CcmD family protein
MGTFVAAYVAFWIAVAVYVFWLGVRQRRLRRAIEALELHFEQSEDRNQPASAAA